MADKDFIVKNGLVVNSSLIIANAASSRVGINQATPDATLTVGGTANVQGNAVITGTVNVTGNSTVTGNANVGGNAYFLTNIAVNANVLLSNAQLLIGNSTVNTTVNTTAMTIGNSTVYTTTNSTSFTGTANNALYLGGVAPSSYVNTTGSYTLSGTLTYGNSIVIGAAYGISANSTYGQANQLLTSNGTSVYWSTPPAGANNAGGTGGIQFYNGTVLGACTTLTFSTTATALTIGNSTVNAVINTSSVVVGNATVNGTITTNSTVSYFTGTANNANYLGGTLAANYLTNTGAYTISGAHVHTGTVELDGAVTIANSITANALVGTVGYVLTSGGTGANVYWGPAVNTANQYTFTNAITIGATGSLTLNGSVFVTNSITANASVGTAGYLLTSGGTGANVYWTAPVSANNAGGTGALQYYNGATFGSNLGLTFSASSNTLNVSNTVSVTNSVFVGNTTINGTITSNSSLTYFTGLSYTANSSAYLGTQPAANFVNSATLTTTLGGYLTTTGTAADSSKLGGVLAANYLTNTGVFTISGSRTHTAAVILNAPVTIANTLSANGAAGSLGNILASGGATGNAYWTTGVTSVTGTSPVAVATGTSTPVISMAAATSAAPGYLTAADWTTFNNKGFGTVTSVTGTAPISVATGTTTPAISMAAATTSVPGYLTAADWTTFNGKQAALGFTPAPLASPTFTGTVTIPAGASISGFAPLASPTFTGTPTVPGYLTTATASTTYAPLASPTFTGTPTVPGYLTTATASSTYATTASLSSYALKADVHYIGTTSIALNRASLAQSLTGVSIDGSAGSATGSAATFTSTTQNSQFNSIGIGTAASATAGEIRATNNITAYYSDDRLKTRFNNIENALAKVQSLSGFHYEANELAQSLGYKVVPEVGVSAQEVQAIMPEVVAPAPIDEKYLTVRYERLVPLLIEAIKELKKEIDELKSNK